MSARIHYADGPVLAGIFQATRGTARIDFPFTEHGKVSSGAVTLTERRAGGSASRPATATWSPRTAGSSGGRRRRGVRKPFFDVAER